MAQTKPFDTRASLDAGIRELVSSARWQAWLDTASKFHNYSFGNQLLIALQMPEATRVAGYNAWKDLGRQVRKGEKSIRILAPRTGYKKDKEAGEKTEEKFLYFVSVGVFDVAQTDGDDLPEIASLLTGAGPAGAWAALVAFAESIGFKVVVQGMASPSLNGYCSHLDKLIAISAANDEAMQVKTLAHEIGHALLHGESTPGDMTRGEKELEAESVAFIVGKELGLDTGDYSFGYVASWAQGGDKALEALKASAARIHDAAKQVINSVSYSAEHLADAVTIEKELVAA